MMNETTLAQKDHNDSTSIEHNYTGNATTTNIADKGTNGAKTAVPTPWKKVGIIIGSIVTVTLVIVAVAVVVGVVTLGKDNNGGAGGGNSQNFLPNPVRPPTVTTTLRTKNPTVSPTPYDPLQVVCDFLQYADRTECVSDTAFALQLAHAGSSIPTEIGLLTQLSTLVLAHHNLYGTIPSELGLLTRLTSLALSSNFLTGTIPETLGDLSLLSLLYLDDNQFSGTIPSSLGSLTLLTDFRTSENSGLTGSIPSNLCLNAPVGFDNDIRIDCGRVECTCCINATTYTPCE